MPVTESQTRCVPHRFNPAPEVTGHESSSPMEAPKGVLLRHWIMYCPAPGRLVTGVNMGARVPLYVEVQVFQG